MQIKDEMMDVRAEHPVLSKEEWHHIKSKIKKIIKGSLQDATMTLERRYTRINIAVQEILAALYRRLEKVGVSIEEAHAIINNIEEQITWMREEGVVHAQ